MKDNDLFPFGTHKGKAMANVPASYFIWLNEQDWVKNWPGVVEYIKNNMDVLKIQAKEEKGTPLKYNKNPYYKRTK